MALNTKLKISNFAKDIGVKSKDIVEILKGKGYEDMSASSSLEHDEIRLKKQKNRSHQKIKKKRQSLNRKRSLKKSKNLLRNQ